MKTNKGTIQGYNGIAAVDKKHPIIVDAQAFGEGQEHPTLKPIIEKIQERYKRLGISENVCDDGVVITADTGFANESNMKYLFDNKINGYVPDNKFRSRDPKFTGQKEKYGKRHQDEKKLSTKSIIDAREFHLDSDAKQCTCPAGKVISFIRECTDEYGNIKQFYTGSLLQCRHCHLKDKCMKNSDSANHRHGNGRQVSFKIGRNKQSYTDWMKIRINSFEGKTIVSHRMSVVEPVFGNLGFNKGLNRFSLRGKKKVDGQWRLFCRVQNIEKLAKYSTIGT